MTVSQSNLSAIQSLSSENDDFVLVDGVFRDYDIRGLAGSELNSEFALRLGKALGQLILTRNQNALFVARDGRLSSDMLFGPLFAPL